MSDLTPEKLALLDAAELLATVRDQITRGALCPMCSTGMVRWTVGLACQLCGTDYSRPEYETLQRDSADTSKAVLADALAVRAERDALATELAHMTEARDNARAEVERLTGRIEAAKRIGLRTHLGHPRADVLTDVLRALDATPETGGES